MVSLISSKFVNLRQAMGGLSLSKQILMGLALGLILGFALGEKVAFLKIFGDIFIRMIRMTVVPLTFIIIAEIFVTMKDASRMGKVAMKCIAIYMLTTVIATSFGITVSEVFKPGSGVVLTPDFLTNSGYTPPKPGSTNFLKVIVDMFPSNVFVSFYNGDILQVLIFACFFGLAMNRVSEESQSVSTFITALSKIIMKLVEIVIKFTPLGVFGIVAYLSGTQALGTLASLAWLFVIIYVSAFFLGYVVYGAILFSRGLSPVPFWKKVWQVQYFTFLTASSAASIPLTKLTCERKLGVSKETSSLTVPLGAALNTDGTALHLGVTSVFLAQIYGLDLNFMQYLQIIFLATVLTVGMAGVPGASLLLMPVILTTIGVPVEYVAVYIGIDRFLDMARSAINVTGDAMVAVVVDKSEERLDIEKYNDPVKIDIYEIRDEEIKEV